MPLSTVIVGCGNIAKAYAKDLKTYPEIALLGFADLDTTRAQAFATEFGGRAYPSFAEVLADPAVQLVVNLTVPKAHEDVIDRCLDAGKHVHTEKPLALNSAAVRRLAAKAEQLGLRLSSAPTTWLGEPQKAAGRVLATGSLGQVRLVYAEVNQGRIESWHPVPAPFYEVGIIWDVGIYPLTLLTANLGPVRRVSATHHLLMPDRKTKDGAPFVISRPEYVLASLTFASGAVARLSCNFYTNQSKQGSSVEFHGDAGTLLLGSSILFNASVEASGPALPLAPVPLARPGKEGVEFAIGVQELAQAIAENRPHRASAAHAAHVIEIMEAIDRSAQEDGRAQSIASDFTRPTLPA